MSSLRKIHAIFSRPEVKHGVSLFNNEELRRIEEQILEKEGRLFIKCQKREKLFLAKPEEIIRQLFISELREKYNYTLDRIEIEKPVSFGSHVSGFADICVLHEDMVHPYIIFEIKRPRRKDGLEQLKSYCNADGAPIGFWSNGNEQILLRRDDPNIFDTIPRIPKSTENLRDILTERWTIDWLEQNDELRKGTTTLKKIIKDLEELVLGNAGVDYIFEEIFKLIYSKLYDEWRGINQAKYQLEFYVGDRTAKEVRVAIGALLEGAKKTWSGVFEPTDKIELRDEHLKVCATFLEKIKLFNSDLRVIDEAFEHLIPEVAKKKEGQFFTPRPVADMVVKMLNPRSSSIGMKLLSK